VCCTPSSDQSRGWGSRKQKANNKIGSMCKIRQDKYTRIDFKIKFKTT
jgi:hypothetical protein